MYIGELIPSPATGSVALFTSWVPRQADNAVLTYEVVNSIGGTTLTVEVYHKNTEESGEGTATSGVGTPEWVPEDGNLYAGTFEGLKELVRFKVSTNSTGLGVHYRILEPTWYNTAKV